MIRIIDSILNSRIFFWIRILQFILAICIFTLVALMPSSLIQTNQSDSLLHFIGNLLLFLSAYVAIGSRLKLWLLGLLLLPYSMLVEASQWLTLTRHVDPNDAIANISGLICGYILVVAAEWCWKRIKA